MKAKSIPLSKLLQIDFGLLEKIGIRDPLHQLAIMTKVVRMSSLLLFLLFFNGSLCR